MTEKQRSEVRGKGSEEEKESSSLPKGWVLAVIPELIPSEGIFVDGDWIESKDQDPDGEVRLIQLADIGDGNFRDKSSRFLTIDRAKALNCTFLRQDDILVARMPDPIGRACLFPLRKEKSFVTAVDVAIIRLGEGFVFPRYLMHCINNPRLRQEIENLQSGTTRKRISRNNFATISFPIPPVSEQQRIVARIEELFSSLDKGIENLKTAQQQLKVYRQAVLKWAFEGRLTNDNVVDGELPKGWKWSRLNAICNKIQDGSHFSPKIQYDEPGENRFPYITAKNIRNNHMDFSKLTYVDRKFHDSIYERCNPEHGDVLLTKDGVNTGEVTLNSLKEAFSLLSSVCIFKTKRTELDSGFLKYFIQSPLGSKTVLGSMTGTAIKRIILRKIKDAGIIQPPLSEQQLIVAEIESRLSVCDKIEETIEQSLKQAESLRQSILKKAFEGKLVPQDPSDEPASELIARIRAERAHRETDPKKGRKSKRSCMSAVVAENATTDTTAKHKWNGT